MLKKVLLSILCLSLFSLAACSDSSSDSKPIVIPSYEGVYDVTFFSTKTYVSLLNKNTVITSSCTKSASNGVYKESEGDSCAPVSKITGQVAIKKNDNGTYSVTTQMQMGGGLVELSPTDKFQYTEYTAVKPNVLNVLEGMGVKGQNYDVNNKTLSSTVTDYPTTPFEISIAADGTLSIHMVLKDKQTELGKVDADTYVKATRTSDTYTALNKTLFWQFPADANLLGNYAVDVFISTATLFGQTTILSNVCNDLPSHGFNYTASQCQNVSVKTGAQVAVDIDSSDYANIFGRIMIEGLVIDQMPSEKYQYFEFSPMPSNSANGVKLSNFNAATNAPSALVTYDDAPFEATLSNGNQDIVLKATINGKKVSGLDANAIVYIKAHRTSSTYTVIPNALY